MRFVTVAGFHTAMRLNGLQCIQYMYSFFWPIRKAPTGSLLNDVVRKGHCNSSTTTHPIAPGKRPITNSADRRQPH